MKITKEQTRLIIITASSVALAYVTYKVVKSWSRHERKGTDSDSDDEILELLEALDKEDFDSSSLTYFLTKLANHAAFTVVQNKVNDLGYLTKITTFLNHTDADVKTQTALLINNLAMNERNQHILKDCIPSLIGIIRSDKVGNQNITLYMAVLNALTNLTTLNSSHAQVLPYICHLAELLKESNFSQVKLQVLKVFVNLSTNDKMCENELEIDAQLLKSVEVYIHKDIDERLILRAVTCCANILTALHRRWRAGRQPLIAAPEFVNELFRENLVRLTSHEVHDIRLQAGRCLIALRPPVNEITVESLDEIDILDVLKI